MVPLTSQVFAPLSEVKDGTITENDPIEQEKRFKYLDLVASALILHNTVDMSLAIQTLMARGEPVHQRYGSAGEVIDP